MHDNPFPPTDAERVIAFRTLGAWFNLRNMDGTRKKSAPRSCV